MNDKISAQIALTVKDRELQATIDKQAAQLKPVPVKFTYDSKGIQTSTYKELGKEYDAITTKITDVNNATKTVTKTTLDYASAQKRLQKEFSLAEDKVANFQTKLNNLKTTGKLNSSQFSKLNAMLENINTEFSKTGDINKFDKQMQNLKNDVSEVTTKMNTMKQPLSEIIYKFTQWYLIAGLVTGAINTLKKIVSTTIKLDEAFSSIQMVTGYNDTQIKELRKSYIDLAQEMSVTVETVTNGADEWLRAGLSVEETNKALRASIILSSVAQMDSATATKYLVAAMNGFNLEANQLIDVVDKLSAIDIIAATSSEELAEAMSVSAKSAQLAGIGLDKYLGMIAVVSETTRQSASTIGNSFKTIFSRLQAVKIGSLFDEEGESISDVDRLLKGYGIDLMTVTDNLNDMGALLDHLGTSWNNYTTAQQSEIATTVAGIRQREKFLVLMSKYDRALQLEQTALESNGSAMDKYQVYQKSLKANIEKLESAWVDFVNELNASGFIEFMLKFADGIMDGIAWIFKWIDSLGAFGDALKALIPVILGATTAIIAFKAIYTGGLSLGSTAAIIAGITAAVGGITVAVKSFTKTTEENTDTNKDNEDQIKDNIKTTDRYTKSLNDLKQQLIGQKSAFSSLIVSMKAEREELEKQEELQSNLLAVEKAREELAKAKNKQVRIFRAGIGFVYESDTSAVQTAQESLNEALNSLSEYKYDLALERAEEFVDELEELLTNGDIINGWDNLFTNFSDLLDSEFGEYLLQTKDFVDKFNNIVGSSGIKIKTNYEKPDNNASGTPSYSGGTTWVGENGPELMRLPKGTEILSNSRSLKLHDMVNNPSKYLKSNESSTILQFNGALNFPNVKTEGDAQGFINELIQIGNQKIPKFN